MAAKHSSVPWTVQKSRSRKHPVLFVMNGRRDPIAMVYTDEHDAALMAAAPRLLSALKALTRAKPYTATHVAALNVSEKLLAELAA